MRLPIALGLSWPDRLDQVARPPDFAKAQSWTFEPVDNQTFPAINLARTAIVQSPLHPAVLNAANEACVAGFLAGRLGYLGIVDTVTAVVNRFQSSVPPGTAPTLEQVIAAQTWAAAQAKTFMEPTS
jgi:1-deoxy-D-xylulose-5-phosphate reductoisomerase